MPKFHEIWSDIEPREFDEKRYFRYTRKWLRKSFRREFRWRRFFMLTYWRLYLHW